MKRAGREKKELLGETGNWRGKKKRKVEGEDWKRQAGETKW